MIDKVISAYLNSQHKYDIACNTLFRTYPKGLETEVLPYKVLKQIHEEAREPIYREHVTNYIYDHPDKYQILNVKNDMDVSVHRWTIDYPEDFILVEKIIKEIFPAKRDFSLHDVLNVFQRNQEWIHINQNIKSEKKP